MALAPLAAELPDESLIEVLLQTELSQRSEGIVIGPIYWLRLESAGQMLSPRPVPPEHDISR